MEHSEPLSIMASDGRRLAADLFTHGPVRAQVIVHGATAVPRGTTTFARLASGLETLTTLPGWAGPGRDDAGPEDWLAAGCGRCGSEPRSWPRGASWRRWPTEAEAITWAAGFSPAERAGIAAKLFVMLPLLTSTLGYLPKQAGLGVDMPAGIVDEWARWCRSSDYFLGDHPELRDRLARYSGSLLALSVDDDSFAPGRTWL
ncbi:MAG: hypothetical protein IPG17_23385 [Sandaracinaceae bacterium]|nr:hypothetical protein [Sandaracinaceae bacterium]